MAVVDGKRAIIDWKTGKDIYEDNIVQVETYRRLWDEAYPDIQINGGFHILRTGKESPMFSHNWYGEFPRAWEAFLHLRELYEIAKDIKRIK